MDVKSSKASPVLTDSPPINKSRLGILTNLLPYSQASATYSNNILEISRKKPGKFDDVRSNGWLDAMRSSSPPRKRILKDYTDAEVASDDGDIVYRAWIYIKYPSALNSFQQIMDHAKNRKLVVFLDYVGTLSPIIDDPDRAFMSADTRSAVKRVAKYFPTAIISGRSRDKVYELVGLKELYYAGSHGMDIMFPAKASGNCTNCTKSTDRQGKEINLFQPARDFLPMINEVFRTLVEVTKNIKGSKVENHKFCISVHYRSVDENSWPIVAQFVYDILKEYSRLRITHGRKVLEVRPAIDWDKGKAVEFLLESLGFSSNQDVLPIYIGDDRTDEDAFKVLQSWNCGYGILVSTVPKETNAFFSLRDPSEVKEFLESLVSMKQHLQIKR